MLRSGLLEGVTIALAGEDAPVARARELGADITAVQGAPDVLVCATGDVDTAFDAVRDVANTWIEADRGGRIVLVAPREDGPQRAAHENLARTLSVEWARFGITPTAILPGGGGGGGEDDVGDVAELVAFLASPAGAYYSGCAFTLR